MPGLVPPSGGPSSQAMNRAFARCSREESNLACDHRSYPLPRQAMPSHDQSCLTRPSPVAPCRALSRPESSAVKDSRLRVCCSADTLPRLARPGQARPRPDRPCRAQPRKTLSRRLSRLRRIDERRGILYAKCLQSRCGAVVVEVIHRRGPFRRTCDLDRFSSFRKSSLGG